MAEGLMRHANPDWELRHIFPKSNASGVKHVLFVCRAGFDSSKNALHLFKKASEKMQFSVAICTDNVGTESSDFKKKLLKADFVVPMSSALVPFIKSSMKGVKKKPRIIDPLFKFKTLGHLARYKLVLRKIDGKKRRPKPHRPV